MENSIKIKIKNVYGNDLIYPDCAVSKAFTELTKTKTFSKEHLKTIKALGYEIKVSQQTISL